MIKLGAGIRKYTTLEQVADIDRQIALLDDEELLREVIVHYQKARADWVRRYGSDKGFAEWMRAQMGGG